MRHLLSPMPVVTDGDLYIQPSVPREVEFGRQGVAVRARTLSTDDPKRRPGRAPKPVVEAARYEVVPASDAPRQLVQGAPQRDGRAHRGTRQLRT
jgi:hypothetical protein